MEKWTFTAIGTEWCITTDGVPVLDTDRERILQKIHDFDQRYSRFIESSEVNSFRNAEPGTYEVSDDLADMLAMSDRLRELTGGVFDPAVTGLLEQAGYDAQYTLKPSSETDTFTLPDWHIESNTLTLDSPAAFDIGGIGKGYLIDKVVSLLHERNYAYFVVDAGGDMFATTKAGGAPWRAAIQYPGKSDTAAGVVDLTSEALAVSDSFRRRWGDWHHIVDPKQRKAIETVIGAAAIAPSAYHADCMTSVCFLASPSVYAEAAREFNAAYLVFNADGSCQKSSNWPGEVFV